MLAYFIYSKITLYRLYLYWLYLHWLYFPILCEKVFMFNFCTERVKMHASICFLSGSVLPVFEN